MMVRAITAFMDAFYIARRNAIDMRSLEELQEAVETYYELRSCYVTVGTFARRGLSSTAKTLRSLSGVRGSEY